jgi:hypothetical protein
LGGMGGFLEIKLVKPTKVVSLTPNEGCLNQSCPRQSQSHLPRKL